MDQNLSSDSQRRSAPERCRKTPVTTSTRTYTTPGDAIPDLLISDIDRDKRTHLNRYMSS
jgi:hypothetical protein